MPSKFILTILGTTFFAGSVCAGLPEAIRSYEAGLYTEALSEFTYLADEQDATALYYLGQMYENGQGVEKDTTKATEYYQKADALGNMQASVQLAKTVFYDDTIENNKEIGLEYLKKTAYNGSAETVRIVTDNGFTVTLNGQAYQVVSDAKSVSCEDTQYFNRNGEYCMGILESTDHSITVSFQLK